MGMELRGRGQCSPNHTATYWRKVACMVERDHSAHTVWACHSQCWDFRRCWLVAGCTCCWPERPGSCLFHGELTMSLLVLLFCKACKDNF